MLLNFEQYQILVAIQLRKLLSAVKDDPSNVSNLIETYKREYETQSVTSPIITECFDLVERIHSAPRVEGEDFDLTACDLRNVYPAVILRNCILTNRLMTESDEQREKNATQYWQGYLDLLIMLAVHNKPIEMQQTLWQEMEEIKESHQDYMGFLCEKYSISSSALQAARRDPISLSYIATLMQYQPLVLAYIEEPLMPFDVIGLKDLRRFFPQYNQKPRIDSLNQVDLDRQIEIIKKLKTRVGDARVEACLSEMLAELEVVDDFFACVYEITKRIGINLKINMSHLLPTHTSYEYGNRTWSIDNIRKVFEILPLENQDFSYVSDYDVLRYYRGNQCFEGQNEVRDTLLNHWLIKTEHYWDSAISIYFPYERISEDALFKSLLAKFDTLTNPAYYPRINKFISKIAHRVFPHRGEPLFAIDTRVNTERLRLVELLGSYPRLLSAWLIKKTTNIRIVFEHLSEEKAREVVDTLIEHFKDHPDFREFVKCFCLFVGDARFAGNQLYLLSRLQEKGHEAYWPANISFEGLNKLAISQCSYPAAPRVIHAVFMAKLMDKEAWNRFYMTADKNAAVKIIKPIIEQQKITLSTQHANVLPYIKVMQAYHQAFIEQATDEHNAYRKNAELILKAIEAYFYDHILMQVDMFVESSKNYAEAISVIDQAIAANILKKPESSFVAFFSGKSFYVKLQEVRSEIVGLQAKRADMSIINNDEETNRHFSL